jgi:hypothetical protein
LAEGRFCTQGTDPDRFIRALLRNNRLLEAFSHTLDIVKRAARSTNTYSNVDHSAALLLPWAIFDELLSIDLAEDPERSVLEPMQKELQASVEQRLSAAEKISASLLAKVGR